MTKTLAMFPVINNGVLMLCDNRATEEQRDYLRDLIKDKDEAIQGGSIVIGVTSKDKLDLLTEAAIHYGDTKVILNIRPLCFTSEGTTLGSNIIYDIDPDLSSDVYTFIERHQCNSLAKTEIVLLN